MDLKARNQITRKDFTPIPTQETIMQQVAQHKYRSVIDMSNAYYQVRVEEEDEQNNTITAGILEKFKKNKCNKTGFKIK